jgi:CubicO group peptidase (beta-lactamase class C family)
MKTVLPPLLALVSLFFASISNAGPGTTTDPAGIHTRIELEAALSERLKAVSTDTDFTLLLQSANGKHFAFNRGQSTADTFYQSASTSKLVTATVIMRLTEQGKLSLREHPQDYIKGWPNSGTLSHIQLRELLSFTSGLENTPLCLNLGNANFEDCALRTPSFNPDAPTPGSRFHYSSAHLQVAGLMAIKASGPGSWQAVFDDFRQQTGLFGQSRYDLPSLQNPRLAGGMHWTANEYMAFLDALYHGRIISPSGLSMMTTNQTAGSVTDYSPALKRIGKNWPYGYGLWIECEPDKQDCSGPQRVSSPGAYGAYPFMDFRYGYTGLLARQGRLGTFSKGYELLHDQDAWLQRWAILANAEP